MQAYTDYKDVDQEQLQKDIENIKKTIQVGEEDFQHLRKLEKWGRFATISGFFIIALVVYLSSYDSGINTFDFWFFGFMRWSSYAPPSSLLVLALALVRP